MLHLRFHTKCAQFEGPLADSAVEVFLELVNCTPINSDRAVGKIPLTFLILQTEVQNTELTVNLTNTFPPNKNKNKRRRRKQKRNIHIQDQTECNKIPIRKIWTYLRLLKA